MRDTRSSHICICCQLVVACFLWIPPMARWCQVVRLCAVSLVLKLLIVLQCDSSPDS